MKTIKLVSLIFILLLAATTYSQRYITKTGHIWFHSEAPFEDIEAHNNQVNAALKTKSGAIVFKVLMKSFIFEKELMQKQFNGNYIESDKYPTATFKGKVSNIDAIDFSKPGSYDTEISGKLTIHGITNHVDATGIFEIKPDMIHGKSKFYIMTTDYDISFSGLLAGQAAIEIEINVDLHLKELKK